MALCNLTTKNRVYDFVKISIKLLKWAWLLYGKKYIANIKALRTTLLNKNLLSWSLIK